VEDVRQAPAAQTLNYLGQKELHDAERLSKRNMMEDEMLVWRREGASYQDFNATEMVDAGTPASQRQLWWFYGNGSIARRRGGGKKTVPTGLAAAAAEGDEDGRQAVS
jgi:hypothetical protein